MHKKWVAIGLTLLLLLTPIQVNAITIMIDPGHGGHDPGAIGVNGLREKDVNLDISLKLKNELLARGYQVRMTRETDIFLSLQERVNLARQSDGELFVSIHANAHPDKSAQGTLILYYDNRYRQSNYPPSSEMAMLSDESGMFATVVQNDLISEIGTIDRGVVPSSVFVVRNGRVPSILVETAFISNKHDAALLASEASRASIARGIANGIDGYQPPVFIDIGGHWAKETVLRLEKLGVVQGFEGKYEPNRGMTRAEYITLLDNVFEFDEMIDELEAVPDGELPIEEKNVESEEIEQVQEGDSEEVLDGEAVQAPDVNSTQILDGSDEQISGDDSKQALNKGATVESDLVTEKATNVGPDLVTEFADLDASHWAFNQMEKAIELGILTGYEDGTVRPDYPLSRAEMAAIFDRVAMQNLELEFGSLPFEDVPEDSWFASSVHKLYHQTIIRGLTETTFEPAKKMTRAEAATVLNQYFASPFGQVVLDELENKINQGLS